MPPYQFKRDHGVIDNGEERPLNASEKERLHGFKPEHTRGYPEKARMSFLGNTFHCVAVAYLLSSWAMITGYLPEQPFVSELWANAGYPYEATDNPDHLYKHLRGVGGA
eukprot:6323200-Karenia_brevis.AAC.1